MDNKIYTHFAACPFCGQVTQFELTIENHAQKTLEEAAIRQCRCPKAQDFIDNVRKLSEADSILDAMFPGEENEHQKLRALLHNGVELLLGEQIAGVTVTISYGKSVKARVKNGNVRITVSERAEQSEEIV